jgi:predicted RNase H-like nuclease
MPPGSPDRAEARIVPADVLSGLSPTVAVDIPIGLMDAPEDGPRPADTAARRFLAERNVDRIAGVGSRVFPSPTRAHLRILASGGTYADLLGQFRKGQHISKQCFMICPKIMEIDTLCQATPDGPIRESHPEIGFTHLAGRTLPSKHRPEGLLARQALLAEAGFDLTRLSAGLPRGRKHWAPDDLLDACILAVTAQRIARGAHAGLPDLTERDSHGLRRVIHY